MLHFFKSLFQSNQLKDLSAKETERFIRKRFPDVIEPGKYTIPARCSRWILIEGPAVSSQQMRATLLVEVTSIQAWSEKHADSVWSSNESEQAARKYLPTWIQESDQSDESVTIPDRHMLAVLQPYAGDFIKWANIRYWCTECEIAYQSCRVEMHERIEPGTENRWVTEWRCPVGHVGYRKSMGSIRLIR